MHNQLLGSQGESLAAEFLVTLGYKVMKRNLRGRTGEIDLLCLHENVIVLVEVKTQQTSTIDPLFKLDRRKQQKLRMLAQQVATKNPEHYIRVDAVTVVMNVIPPRIRHYINIL